MQEKSKGKKKISKNSLEHYERNLIKHKENLVATLNQ